MSIEYRPRQPGLISTSRRPVGLAASGSCGQAVTRYRQLAFTCGLRRTLAFSQKEHRGDSLENWLIVPPGSPSPTVYLLRRFAAENERMIAEMLREAIP